MLRLAWNDNGKGIRATVRSQASKTIDPCAPGQAEEKLQEWIFLEF